MFTSITYPFLIIWRQSPSLVYISNESQERFAKVRQFIDKWLKQADVTIHGYSDFSPRRSLSGKSCWGLLAKESVGDPRVHMYEISHDGIINGNEKRGS